MNKKIIVLIAVIVYLASAGISYSLFSKTSGLPDTNNTNSAANPTPATGNDYQALTFDQSQPKTEACPLNGVLYSSSQKAWWQKHRPLGVMIENHQDARPQSGINAS